MEVIEHDECTIVLQENIEHRTGASLHLGLYFLLSIKPYQIKKPKKGKK